jgi:hypothetical protein
VAAQGATIDHAGTGPPAGAAAPEVSGVDLDGRPVLLATEQHHVLAFLTSGCTSCAWWWQQLGTAGPAVLPGVVAVTPDPGSDAPVDIRPLAGDRLRVIMSSDAWESYGIKAGSSFVVVERGRVRAAGTASDWDGLVALVTAGHVAEPGH